MFHLSRRQFVVSAAGATALFGLDRPVSFITPAAAQKGPGNAGLLDKGFVKFKVGDIEVTQVYDGTWEKAHDPAFIKNASVDETKSALKAAGLTDAYVPIPFTVTIIKSKGKTVMFDSGTGGQAAPTAGLMMAKNFYKAGLDPLQVSTVAVTHFHPDHIFGLISKDTNSQVFAHAEIVMPAAEYKYWTNEGVIAQLPEARQGLAKRIQATFPKWKNIRQIEDGKEVIPGVIAVASFGHTPGHTSYLVSSGKKQLMVLGDVSNVPALFVKNPNWQAAFDQDAALAESNRRKMFDRVIADKITVTGYHYGLPGAGTLAKDGSGYAFTAIKA